MTNQRPRKDRASEAARRRDRLMAMGFLGRLAHGSRFQGLMGAPLEMRTNARAALIAGVVTALLVTILLVTDDLPQIALLDIGLDHVALLSLFAGIAAAAAILTAATAAAMTAPPQLSTAIQIVLTAAVAAGLFAVYAQPADRLAGLAELTRSRLVLCAFCLVLALPFGFALHKIYPFRSFVLAALVVFGLILPDFFGAYAEETGTVIRRGGITHAQANNRFLSEEAVAAFRALGVQPVFYATCLASAWTGLVLPTLVRAARRRRP